MVLKSEKNPKMPAGVDEGFGLCIFFQLKICSQICTKALTAKPFTMQASDLTLGKKKRKEWDGGKDFQEFHYQKK